jgi:hypothetical protein
MLADTFPENKRSMAFAVYGVAVLVGPDYRPDARRLAYRQSLLALDFPHQRSDRGALARPGELARDRTGSAAA